MKRILDPCCGSRMFWYDKQNPDVEFCDIRDEEAELICDRAGRTEVQRCVVHPDRVCDVTNLPFEDNTFWHIVLDPPHVWSISKTSWLAKKYGVLDRDHWQEFIRAAFTECWRVLKPNGTLIFKWSDKDVKLKELPDVLPQKPLYGHRSGKSTSARQTHWLAFVKGSEHEAADM